jgi:hypothetical protein
LLGVIEIILPHNLANNRILALLAVVRKISNERDEWDQCVNLSHYTGSIREI